MTPKITIVVPGRWHAFDLARELERLGALHRIVTTYPRSRLRGWGIPDEKIISLPLSLVLARLAWKIGGQKLAMRQQYRINSFFASRAARNMGCPDLIHAWSGTAEPSLLVARARGIPTVLERSSSHMLEQCRILQEEHDLLGLKWEATPQATVKRELREYELAARVFVPSLFVERSFLARGFPANRLYRNGFGVDVSCFTTGQKEDSVFRVVYAGALSARKGLHYLVRAFKEANISNCELLLVGGDTPETDQLIGETDSRIRRVGHVPQSELPGIYRSSSVFAMASLEEGQAYVQAQALACGLPLICTTNTGGEDLLALGSNGRPIELGVLEFDAGYVVPPRSTAAFASVFRRLANDSKKLAAMISATAAIVRKDISWRRYAEKCIAQYALIQYNA